jgi:excisionase family DNA binding protein
VATNERKVILTAREAADYLRISLFTLNRIERERLLIPFRTPGGHRRYSLEMLNEYLENNRYAGGTEEAAKKVDSPPSARQPVHPERERPALSGDPVRHSGWTFPEQPQDAAEVRPSTPLLGPGQGHPEEEGA